MYWAGGSDKASGLAEDIERQGFVIFRLHRWTVQKVLDETKFIYPNPAQKLTTILKTNEIGMYHKSYIFRTIELKLKHFFLAISKKNKIIT